MRAYTYIDKTKAHAGNAWIDRGWSAFFGATTSLVDRIGRFDWIASRCGEIGAQVQGHRFGVLDFGEVEFSEENSPLGATLIVEKRRPGLTVRIRTMAFHEFPAMLRMVTFLNLCEGELRLDPVTVDCMALRKAELTPATLYVLPQADGAPWEFSPDALIAKAENGGLVLGTSKGCAIQQMPDKITFKVAGKDALNSGRQWALPPTFYFAFEKHFDDQAQAKLSGFLRACYDSVKEPASEDDQAP